MKDESYPEATWRRLIAMWIFAIGGWTLIACAAVLVLFFVLGAASALLG